MLAESPELKAMPLLRAVVVQAAVDTGSQELQRPADAQPAPGCFEKPFRLPRIDRRCQRPVDGGDIREVGRAQKQHARRSRAARSAAPGGQLGEDRALSRAGRAMEDASGARLALIRCAGFPCAPGRSLDIRDGLRPAYEDRRRRPLAGGDEFPESVAIE